ncbi:MAG: YsnF/AvaK domain-containing protein [Singulisphaera sp.]|nr:YsnF/AvaK domain-containing protein [Singulisphaera sp.]
MATTTERQSTVVGVFEDRRRADAAISELRKAGFREDQIGVASRQTEGEGKGEAASTTTGEQGTKWETGAIAGALTGAGLGGLVGLGILAGVIPVIGPVIAGGTLAVILANAAGGAAIGGLLGALTGAGIPEEEARYYQGEFEAGRTIVTVTADGRYDEAVAILRRHGAYDQHTAASRAASTPATAATTAGAAPTAGAVEGGQTVQVKEEELEARKQPVETGEVKVRKEVHTEQKTMDVPVQREEVVVERHAPTGSGATSDIREGEEIRVPVMEEQVAVEKKPVVKEEVTVGKRVVQDTERVGGEVRKEDVRVEHEGEVDVREGGTGQK